MQRSAKFAKYLPGFGWRPTVWTIADADGLPRDETLCHDMPAEVTVCCGATAGGVRALRRSLRGFANARAGEGWTAMASRFAKAVDWRLESWVTTNSFPDDCIGWARRSLGVLRASLSAEDFAAIYSTYSPASNHWLGLELKRASGLPWVADFRDLWTQDCRYRCESPARRAAHQRLEQDILEAADAVIGVTERQTEILAARVPDQSEKFYTITNGFDPDDFAHVHRRTGRNERFILSYVGRFDLSQTPESWFRALRQFATCLGDWNDRFCMRFVGHVNPTARAKFAATGIACEFHPYLPHRQAIQAMCDADALLLSIPCGPNGDSIIPAKVFEYLATQRPIIAVGPPGSICAEVIRNSKGGICSDFDEAAILSALSSMFDAWRAGKPVAGASAERLAAFDRMTLTGCLADILEKVSAGPAEAAGIKEELVACGV